MSLLPNSKQDEWDLHRRDQCFLLLFPFWLAFLLFLVNLSLELPACAPRWAAVNTLSNFLTAVNLWRNQWVTRDLLNWFAFIHNQKAIIKMSFNKFNQNDHIIRQRMKKVLVSKQQIKRYFITFAWVLFVVVIVLITITYITTICINILNFIILLFFTFLLFRSRGSRGM